VGIIRTTVIDPSRSTPARGPTVASPVRELGVTIRYPTAGSAGPGEAGNGFALAGSFPLIVFGHGYELADFTYPHFLHDLAAQGFVVADPEFPLSSAALPGPPVAGDEPNQVRDLSYVTNQLLDPLTRPGALSAVTLVPPIGVAGHSDGGVTAAGMAGSACCADSRVGAAVILAGALADFAGAWFTNASPPLLVIHGDTDEVNPVASSRGVYDAAQPPKFFVLVHGGTHIGAFESDATRPYVVQLAADFLRAYLLHDSSAASRVLTDASVPGVLDLQANAQR
jgi:predicted dienelactone hydrolase